MEIEKVKRYSLVEVALLVLFMLGLLFASQIVRIRSRVILSDPMPLSGSGLSVSLPANKGWERTPGWQYEEAENSMTLIGQFGDPERGGISVRWRYYFSSPDASEQELLEQKAKEVNAVIQEKGSLDLRSRLFYAKLVFPQSPRESVYLGMVRLDSNRLLELLVKSYRSGGFYEENVLQSVAGSIQYTPLQDIADGRDLIDTFLMKHKNASEAPLFAADEAFLIKNTFGKDHGYYYAHNLEPGEKEWLFRIQIQQLELNSLKLASELRFNPLNEAIDWDTKFINPRTRGTLKYKIFRANNDKVHVARNDKEINTFPAGQPFLPEPLLTAFVYTFLESNYESVIIDVLGIRGQLVPVQLTKLSPEEVKIKSDAAKLAIRIDYLYHPDSYEELLFDGAQKLLGKSEYQPGRRPRIWEVVSVETLQQIFQDNFDSEFSNIFLKDKKNVEQRI